ncbi:hypothetical protein AMECASPLE_026172 [Ameca splendens]|uniref:SWIM-type domain-containing protein n=1 Tax=Ameca splendens TaxID=208324 RepID=A0ABV1AEG8_9TELE
MKRMLMVVHHVHYFFKNLSLYNHFKRLHSNLQNKDNLLYQLDELFRVTVTFTCSPMMEMVLDIYIFILNSTIISCVCSHLGYDDCTHHATKQALYVKSEVYRVNALEISKNMILTVLPALSR